MRGPDGDLRALALRIFDDVRALTFDGVGVSRESYGEGETKALAYLRDLAEAQGFATGVDAAGDLTVDLPGTDGSLAPVVAGSHLDSVPQGGNYDGLAGTAAALLALIATARGGERPRRGLRALGLRGEESAWYGKAYVASSALFGLLGDADLARRHRASNRTLAEAMAAVGVDVERIRNAEPLVDPRAIHAFVELHIEQGPVMVAREMPVAIVTGIRGNIRHRTVRCVGEAGHSGAVPRWLRHDAVLATAELLNRLDENWRVLLEQGHDLVLTVGILHTNPAEHAMSRIPGDCTFSLEIRSRSQATLDEVQALVRSEAAKVARERGVSFLFDEPILSPPAVMADSVIAAMERGFAAAGLAPERVPSGAGHDAAIFATAGVPSGMIFVRNRHGSHNPHEAMDIDDFMLGVSALTSTLQELAR